MYKVVPAFFLLALLQLVVVVLPHLYQHCPFKRTRIPVYIHLLHHVSRSLLHLTTLDWNGTSIPISFGSLSALQRPTHVCTILDVYDAQGIYLDPMCPSVVKVIPVVQLMTVILEISIRILL
ncbi:hypothetical protein PTI98_010958 [Pleurotus ostreatus]|nr:hypothetical protein PTI98_010958 [Pleurotus ostreatus]